MQTVPRTMFVSDYDRGIVVQHQGATAPVQGAQAEKCVYVSQRMALTGFDGLLLYRPLSSGYVDYCAELGAKPLVYAPAPELVRAGEPLNLIEAVMQDDALLARLRAENVGLTLDPFIASESVYRLAHAVGASVRGCTREFVDSDQVAVFNDKRVFQRQCVDLGIPIPSNSTFVDEGLVLAAAVAVLLCSHESVMLRQVMAAAGLGNLRVSRSDLGSSFAMSAVHEWLLRKIPDLDSWSAQGVLVAPFLDDLVGSPAVLVYVTETDIDVVSVTEQLVRDGISFMGSIYPSIRPSDTLGQMTEWTVAYAREFQRQGGRGYISLDWGVRRSGQLVAFECNARWTGSVHPMLIARRLIPQGELAFVSRDAIRVKPIELRIVRETMRRAGLEWNPEREEGVVISIPPTYLPSAEATFMGMVAIARTRQRAIELESRMREQVFIAA